LATGLVTYFLKKQCSQNQLFIVTENELLLGNSEPTTYAPPAEYTPVIEEPVTTAAEPSIKTQGIIFLFWIVGELIFIALLLQRTLFVRRIIAQSKPASEKLEDILAESCQKVGIRKKVELKISRSLLSPAACGLLKPKIILPSSLLKCFSIEKLHTTLLHELAHIKRKDIWINSIQSILQILYFYNPLLWIANTIVRRVREQAVDETVLVYLGEQADTYSSTLVDIAEIAFAMPSLGLNTIGVVESKKALTIRIKHILSRPFPKTVKIGVTGLLVIILAALVLIPMARGYEVTNLGGLYEKAVVSRDFVVKAGPTEFSANTIIRWNRNGSPIITDPKNEAMLNVPYKIPDYSQQAAWMDITQVYISPDVDKYEAIELRVFDHEKREILNYEDYIGIGYNIQNSAATIYSIGQLLPDRIDLWMRVIHKPEGTVVNKIPAQENAVVNLPDNTLKILEIKKGTYSYSSGPAGINWTKHDSEYDEVATSVAFQFNADDNNRRRFQICAVSKDGQRYVPDYPHFISSANGRHHVITIGFPKEQIDYFEITPFVSRDTFYFDGIKLPKVSDVFATCPEVTFNIKGSEGEFTSNTLSPVELKLFAFNNKIITGVSGSADNWRNTFLTPKAQEGASGFALKINGIRTKNFHLSYLDQSGKKIDPNGIRNKNWASGGSATIIVDSFNVPLEQIHSVAFRISTKDENEQQTESQKTNKFKATLPNGVTVELVGVCEHPSTGKQWWKPDGSILEKAPYEKLDHIVDANEDAKIREFAIHFSGQNLEDANYRNRWFGGQIQSSHGYRLSQDLMAITAAFSKNKLSTTIPIDVSAGPWETRAVGDGKREVSIAIFGGETIYQEASEENGKSIIPIIVRSILGDDGRQLWDNRIIAKDMMGKKLIGRQFYGAIRGRSGWYRYEFELPLEQIASFEYQTRPYYQIDFDNVALEPGEKTDVQVQMKMAGTSSKAEMMVQKEIQSIETNTITPPVWITFLPASPICSLADYQHSQEVESLSSENVKSETCELEIRSASDNKRIARLTYDNYPISGGRWGCKLNKEQIQEIGAIKDGMYLAAMYVNGIRCSNVAEFTIDSNADLNSEPTLKLVPLPLGVGQVLPYLGIIATGPNPTDPELAQSAIYFPDLFVDGIERKVKVMKWAGPDRVLQAGSQGVAILDLENYTPAIELNQPHEVWAKFGKYQSATVVIPANDTVDKNWNESTDRLNPALQSVSSLEGTITDPEGKPASYDISLLGEIGTNIRTRSGQDGKYDFSNLPVGNYSFDCNPHNQGYPHFHIKTVQLQFGKRLILNLNLKSRYLLSGRVTYADGSPAAGLSMMASCEDGQTIFYSSAKTDEQGRYTLSSPLTTSITIRVQIMPYGYTTREDFYRGLAANRDDINFVLIKTSESNL
jgi:beta-lactamase regulating signal transducer with metallopeptidase domain